MIYCKYHETAAPDLPSWRPRCSAVMEVHKPALLNSNNNNTNGDDDGDDDDTIQGDLGPIR